MKAKIKLKNLKTNFYEYSQNNSGGSLHTDDKLCHRVYIEADNAQEANDKAEQLGMYWNGCDDEIDCPCCGDRWYSASEPVSLMWDGTSSFHNIEDYVKYISEHYPYHGAGKVDSRIYYADGTVKEFS